MTIPTKLSLPLALLGCALLVSPPAAAQVLGDVDADGVSDSTDAFPCAPEAAAAAFVPAQGVHGTLLFEDQWPQPQVDYDFNDVALTYNYVYRLDAQGRALAVRMTFNAQALGGVFNNGLGVSLPVDVGLVQSVKRTFGNGLPAVLIPSSTDAFLTVDLTSNLRVLFGGQIDQINSLGSTTAQTGQVLEVEVTFNTPVNLDLAAAPYDVYLFRSENRGLEIHLPQYSGTSQMDTTLFNTGADGSGNGRFYVDTSGLPYALHMPDRVDYPAEGVDVAQLFPNIVTFAASGGTQAQDFYVSQVDRANAYSDVNGGSAPAARFTGLDHTTANTACVQSWGLALEFGRTRSQYVHDSAQAPNGDVVVTGYVQGTLPNQTSSGGVDAFVSRYDSATGAVIWTLQFGSTGDDVGRSVAVSATGDIYVSGDVRGVVSGSAFAGGADAFVMNLDAGGNVVWTQVVGTSGNETGAAVAVDGSGNIVLAGGTTSSNFLGSGVMGNSPSNYLMSFSPDGSTNWSTQYATDAGSPSNFGYTLNMAIDPLTGDVYTVGSDRRYNVAGSAADGPWVARTSGATGGLIWVTHLGGHAYRNTNTDQRYGYAYDVGVDPTTGTAYVTGHWGAGAGVSQWGDWKRMSGDTSADAFFTALAANGLVLFNTSMGSTDAVDDFGESLTVSPATGAVYYAGRTAGTLPGQLNLGGDDYYVAAYDLAGAQLWVTQNGTANHDEGHTVLTLLDPGSTSSSPLGDLLVVGNTAGALSGSSAHVYALRLMLHTLDTGAFSGTVVAAQNKWATGPFSACSATCGNGIQTRTVYCTDHLGGTVADTQCIEPRPTTTQTCSDLSGCTFSYVPSAWSACSQTCGNNGTQTRTLSCFRSDGTPAQLSDCSGQQAPVTSQTCQDFSTCSYGWFAGTFGQCSSTCGAGVQGRTVYCERSDGTPVADSFCASAGPRPATTQTCTGAGNCQIRQFTTCGASGASGPAFIDCAQAYAGTLQGEEVFVSGGVQQWYVLQSGTYRIEVWGAEGGARAGESVSGGKGGYVAGDFQLGSGTVLGLVVGQQGVEGGGGGGSYVFVNSTRALLAAAGGGGGASSCVGAGSCPDGAGVDGVVSAAGTADRAGTVASGGSGGDGGLSTGLDPLVYDIAGAGAGFVTAGANGPTYGACTAEGGQGTQIGAALGGLLLGTCATTGEGGFGGGGAPLLGAGGGGGGYSGGGAGLTAGALRSGGGAGGSFNGGTSQVSAPGARAGHGQIRITAL